MKKMGRYAEILKEYIEQSKLSLSEIETELRKKGFNKNKSYLSNLQNGKVEPPSSEVNIALAEIIGADPIRLILTPLLESMKSMKQNEKTNEDLWIKVVTDIFIGVVCTMADVFKDEYYQFIIKYFDEYFDNTPNEEDKEDFINFLGYEQMREVYDEIPEEELMKTVIPFQPEIKEESTQSDEFTLEVSSDEEQYLIECLNLYRKMQLKPKVPTQN
jgi:transcriptional regulator with XRE-family HTH domain